MLTQTFQVFNLRGMDQRWVTQPHNALYIQDMTWNSADSWATSGGWSSFFRQSPYYKGTKTTISTTSDPDGDGIYEQSTEYGFNVDYYVYPFVRSMHWFSQHNGARQFLVYEQQTWDVDNDDVAKNTLELRYFDGSRAYWDASTYGNNEPSRLMVKFKRDGRDMRTADIGRDLEPLDKRSDPGLCVPTQYQAWGNRLYILNGYQEPLVFNGEYAEVAGFRLNPAEPYAEPCDWLDSATFPIALGMDWDTYNDPSDTTKDAINTAPELANRVYESNHWMGRFRDYKFHGMGPGSFAKYKTGKYRPVYISSSFGGDGGTIPAWSEAGEAGGTMLATDEEDGISFGSTNTLKFALRFNKQLDRRKVGWRYKVTFVNERGQESEPSKASPLAVAYNGTSEPNHHGATMLTVTIPRGPSECVARRLYRTRNLYNTKGRLVGRGSKERYYFLKEFEDNMTERWVDAIPDSSLGSLLGVRKLGAFPPNARFISSFKNTMFVCGETDNQIRYSVPNFPETFPRRNRIDIGDGDGGPITGIRATKNALVVFKSKGIYLIKGDSNKGFSAQTLTRDVGMSAPGSLAELPGLGLAFLSEKGIYLLEGALENTGTITNIVKISTEISHQIEIINSSASVRAVGLLNEDDGEYWLSVPVHGSEVNNLLLVYHYMAGSWSVRENFPISCGTTSKDHRGYVFFGIEYEENISKTYDPPKPMARTSEEDDTEDDGYSVISRTVLSARNRSGIGIYSKGYSYKGNKWHVDPIYKTPNHPFGTVFSSVQPAYVYVYGIGYGDNQMSLNYTVNRSVFEVRKNGQNVDQQDPNNRYPVFGKARWDEDYWGEYRPTVFRYDVSTTHKGPTREFGVTFAKASHEPSGTKIEIIGYDVEAKVGEQRKIKPLNEALKPDRR